MRRGLLTLLVLLLLLPVAALAQDQNLRRPPQQPPGTPTPQTTGMAVIQWEITGPLGPTGGPRPPFTVALAQSYIYRAYKLGDAVGNTLTPTACTTTNDPYMKTCQAPLPTVLDVPTISVDVTATISGVESPHSASTVVPGEIVPPAAPSNVRIFRTVLNILARPFKPLASR